MTKKIVLLPSPVTDISKPCVVRDVLDRVGERWSLLILAHLADTPQRFNTLHRVIDSVSKQVLSRTLRRLEEDGFIRRTVYNTKPPQVEYALTGMGISFLSPLKTLINWAEAYQHTIADARIAFRFKHGDGEPKP